jgi:hypothetical protein
MAVRRVTNSKNTERRPRRKLAFQPSPALPSSAGPLIATTRPPSDLGEPRGSPARPFPNKDKRLRHTIPEMVIVAKADSSTF